MDVASNNDALTEIGKCFVIFYFRGFILTAKYRENWKTAKISVYMVAQICKISVV